MSEGEAHIEGQTIVVNGGVKVAATFILSGIGAILVIMAGWVNANTEKININNQKVSSIEAKLDYIISNQDEFKLILKRTVPYERSLNRE